MATAKYTLKEKINNVINLYDELIFCKLANKESSKCRYIKPEEGYVGVDFLGTYDGDNITFYYKFVNFTLFFTIFI